MKYLSIIIVFLIISSCKKDDLEIVNFRVNHYKQSAFGLHPDWVLLVQEGDKIGTDEWRTQFSKINGFNYEWGYVYELRVKKRTINNPPADGSSIEFDLEEIVSKTSVGSNLTFNLLLKSSTRGIEGLVENNNSDFNLLNEQGIDCSDLCVQLAEFLASQDELTGVFVHADSDSIKLLELVFD